MNPLDRGAPRWGRNWPRIAVAAFAAVVVAAIVAAAATSATPFGPYNYAWDGTSDVRDRIADDPETDLEIVHETSPYDDADPTETVAFVVAPDEPDGDESTDRIRRFVEDGGTLVVFDNFGPHSNELLVGVGADARTDGRLVRDDVNYVLAPTMPIARTVEDGALVGDADELALNYATAIESGDATVVAETSDFAYLVEDETTELRVDHELAARPVVTTENVGDGRVIVVGDPSILVNAMVDRSDNFRFVENLYANESMVLFDVSRTEDVPLLVELLFFLQRDPTAQMAVGLLGIGLVAVLAGRPRSAVARALDADPGTADGRAGAVRGHEQLAHRSNGNHRRRNEGTDD